MTVLVSRRQRPSSRRASCRPHPRSAYGYPLTAIRSTKSRRLIDWCFRCQLVAEELLHAEVQQHMWKQQRAALHPDDDAAPEGAEGQGDGRSFGEALLEAESGWKQPASPPAPKADAADDNK